jgi:putative membrane protein
MKIFKIYLMGVIVFFFASFFRYQLPSFYLTSILSAFFIIILAIPSYYYLYQWVGMAKAFTVIGIISVLSLIIEIIAVITGLPYGNFYYSEDLGFKIFGLVPWLVGLAYPPILLGSIAISRHLVEEKWVKLVPTATLFNILVDLVLDPAAVTSGLWSWNVNGIYYGVPLINFIGWFMTGFIYINIIYYFTRDELVRGIPITITGSVIWILSFWSGYLIWSNIYFPALIGLIVLTYLLFKNSCN